MQNFDKSQIKANFNRANQSYDYSAFLQKIVAKNLILLAKKDITLANKILDLGCGTGFIFEQINQKNKTIFQLDIAYKMLQKNSALNNKINGDIDFLPFRKNSFDLALSSLSLQWINNLSDSVFQTLDTLKNGGNFYFSLVADGSLAELKKTCQDCDVPLSINDFITEKNLTTILKKQNFDYQIKSEEIVLKYDNLYHLLKSLKLIGANYSNKKQYIGKKQFVKIADFYFNNFYSNNNVFATWQVFYVAIKIHKK